MAFLSRPQSDRTLPSCMHHNDSQSMMDCLKLTSTPRHTTDNQSDFPEIILISNLKHNFFAMRTVYDITWIHGRYRHITFLAVPGSRHNA
jgi:hypothetical protein